LREFLAKSGTTGIAGAVYMVPDALHTHLIGASYTSDKVPLFAAEVVNGWNGGDLLVDIAKRQAEGTVFKWTLRPQLTTSGATQPSQTVETVQATLKPIMFSVTPRIGNDLIEDENFQLVEWHATQAAQQIGQYATDLAIADLKAASDGDGTQASHNAGADTTTSANVLLGVEKLGSEFWNPNTMICTHKAWADAICVTASDASLQFPPPPEGYDAKFQMLDTIFCNSKNLHAAVSSNLMTNCVTIVLDRRAALLCGRKRWMQIENYAEPIRDLSNIVVTCRQDNVTLYKDASCEITET